MKKSSKILALVLALVLIFSVTVSAYSPKEMSESVSEWLVKNVTVNPESTEIDSNIDWTVFATLRCGENHYKSSYKAYINAAVSENSDTLYLSDFARISLAAMSAGLNPKKIGGHNLIDAIAKTDLKNEAYTGSIAYAIIALRSAYNAAPEKQEELLKILLASQRADGGFNAYLAPDPAAYWTLGGETDSTGIALQALGLFAERNEVKTAIGKAVTFLKTQQMADGSFGAWGSASAESTAMVLAGLCAVGIDPVGAEFSKGECTVITALSSFINQDGGARCWDGSSNTMTGYQLLCGVNAYKRAANGELGIYQLSLLDAAKHSIKNSFVGKLLPEVANLACNATEYFFTLLKIESYK